MWKATLTLFTAPGCSLVLLLAHFGAYAQQPGPQAGKKAAPKGGVEGRLTWLDRREK